MAQDKLNELNQHPEWANSEFEGVKVEHQLSHEE